MSVASVPRLSLIRTRRPSTADWRSTIATTSSAVGRVLEHGKGTEPRMNATFERTR
jgi:hypothetical protein